MTIHTHHRKLRRGKDERPVNLIGLPDVIHQWVHDNPEKAYEAGLLVRQHDDPAEIMVTIPEEALQKVRAKRAPNASTPEQRKARKTTQIKTPNGEENVIPEMVDAARTILAPQMGWDDDVPAYFIITAALARVVQEA